MALFKKKEEKSPFDEIMEAYHSLSDEDKDKVRKSLEDVEKAEDEREIDKIEEEKAEDIEKKDEKSEEVNEESEEIGEKIDEVEDEEKSDDGEEDEKSEEEPKDDDKVDYGKISELIDGLTARIDAYDERFARLEGLADTLENYNKEVEGRFGLASKFEEGNSEDDRDMSYYDYKKKILGMN